MQPALATRGATPFYPTKTGKLTGQLSTLNKPVNLANSPAGTPGGYSPAVGTNPGMLGVSTPPKVILNGKETVSKGSPSVVAQQKTLNEANIKTQGYVPIAEDGFFGDKTKAAFQQYGFNTQTGQPNTPKTTTTSNTNTQNQTLIDPIDINERGPGQKYGTITSPPLPGESQADWEKRMAGGSNQNSSPQVGSASENAQTVLNSGQQTQNEIDAQKRLIELSQGASPEYTKNNEAYLQSIKDYNQSVQNQAGAMAGEAGRAIPLGFVQGRQQVLQSQYGAQQAGLGGLVSGMGSALGAANTQQGLQQGAAQSAYSGAQTQASRAQGAAGTVFGASLPGQISGSTRTYNPLDPTGTSTIESGVNNQSKYDMLSQYNTGTANLLKAKGIENQIASTLGSNADLNSQPISFLTNLNQYVSGQLGTVPQQLLAQQVNSYIQTLGLDPAAVVSIATQQKGTLAQLLKSLKNTATNNNEALKTTANNLPTTNSSSSDSTTEGNSTGYAHGGAF
jgi:hypothetical protein